MLVQSNQLSSGASKNLSVKEDVVVVKNLGQGSYDIKQVLSNSTTKYAIKTAI